MTPVEILTLATDAATYDAVVILWVTRRGTQPVLLPRSFGTSGANRGRVLANLPLGTDAGDVTLRGGRSRSRPR
jgi:hypothetical protein